jgi:MFS family permease
MRASPPTRTQPDPFAALRFRDFRLLFFGRFIWQLGEQLLNTAVAWEIYERTGSELALGLVGLVQVLPVIVLALFAGQAADRFDRKQIIIIIQVLLAACGAALALLSLSGGSLPFVFVVLLLTGIGAAFHSPALASFIPMTIDSEHYVNAATWGSNSWQLASMLGPALGGFLISASGGAGYVYLLNVIGCGLFIGVLLLVRPKASSIPLKREPVTRDSLLSGVRYIRAQPVIFGAITLDMFAVLFGGAVALLPVFAKDVLEVGAEGYGLMRAAPSIGAVIMALTIASRPPFTHAGRTLLIAVAGFGVATIIFGLSRSFILSLVLLALLGALDNISVVIRQTLMLTRVPDDLRGRISAVNNMFIGISNELGTFESGVTAALLGPVGAVVFGGVGTLVVVTVVIRTFPALVKLERL